jgi:hypothetical protein
MLTSYASLSMLSSQSLDASAQAMKYLAIAFIKFQQQCLRCCTVDSSIIALNLPGTHATLLTACALASSALSTLTPDGLAMPDINGCMSPAYPASTHATSVLEML